MVCTANICRSPMAAAMLKHLLRKQGIARRVRVDSAGTRAITGHPPDVRAQAAVRRWGGKFNFGRSRPVKSEDLARYDLILCMEQGHMDFLLEKCPDESSRQKVKLIMDFAPQLDERELPDPYFGNASGFTRVLHLLEAALQGLLKRLQAEVRG